MKSMTKTLAKGTLGTIAAGAVALTSAALRWPMTTATGAFRQAMLSPVQ